MVVSLLQAPNPQTAQSRTRSPQMEVLRMPVVGRAMLEKGNLLISMAGMTSRRWRRAASWSMPNTSRASSVDRLFSRLRTERIIDINEKLVNCILNRQRAWDISWLSDWKCVASLTVALWFDIKPKVNMYYVYWTSTYMPWPLPHTQALNKFSKLCPILVAAAKLK